MNGVLLQYVENYGENFHRDVSYAVSPFFAFVQIVKQKGKFEPPKHVSRITAMTGETIPEMLLAIPKQFELFLSRRDCYS
jgi:hypothetical protein